MQRPDTVTYTCKRGFNVLHVTISKAIHSTGENEGRCQTNTSLWSDYGRANGRMSMYYSNIHMGTWG
jgi:hypothetical protein